MSSHNSDVIRAFKRRIFAASFALPANDGRQSGRHCGMRGTSSRRLTLEFSPETVLVLRRREKALAEGSTKQSERPGGQLPSGLLTMYNRCNEDAS